MIEHYFLFIFNRVMALDWYWNFVYAQYLVDQLMDFDKILKMHWYWQNVGKDNYKLFFNGVLALDWCQAFVSICETQKKSFFSWADL